MTVDREELKKWIDWKSSEISNDLNEIRGELPEDVTEIDRLSFDKKMNLYRKRQKLFGKSEVLDKIRKEFCVYSAEAEDPLERVLFPIFDAFYDFYHWIKGDSDD